MKQNIYSIYDRATMEFTAPFFTMSDEAAIRAVRGSLSSQSQLVLYPADYVLRFLGEFDSETGVIETCVRDVEEIKVFIPIGLRKYALDGTFGGDSDGKEKEDSPA